jgi:peptide-methionine (S)-S-oxide reductase
LHELGVTAFHAARLISAPDQSISLVDGAGMTSSKHRWAKPLMGVAALGVIAVVLWRSPLYGAESPVVIAPPALDNPKASGPLQTAVLAGGCFWGVQGVFEHVRGVKQVVSGYAGGDQATAQYETVSSGTTGHAESVKITFDPAEISYGRILQIAFSVVHDPTQLNRQGPDTGTQYRSAIFYADATQKRIAEAYIRQLDESHAYPRAIVTRVDALKGFYPAEDYHQDYLVHHPTAPYIAYNDMPKVENFKQLFPELYVDRPVLTSAR